MPRPKERHAAAANGVRALTTSEHRALLALLEARDDDAVAALLAATGRDPAPYLRFVNPGDKRGLALPSRDLPGEVDLVAALSAESYMRL